MPIDMNMLAGGALAERVAIELQRVAANISDPNTKAEATRSLTVKLTIKPDEQREIGTTLMDVKVSLAPARGIPTRFVIDKDNSGKAVISELKSAAKNQMMIDNDGELADDKGNKVAPGKSDSNVVNFK